MQVKRGNIDELTEMIMRRKRKGLAIAGALVQSQARNFAKVGKYPSGSGMVGGALRQSIYSVVKGDSCFIGSNLVYAAIQEFGGVITPHTAKALTIPIAPEAFGKRARDFDDLFVWKHDNKAFLAKSEDGKMKIYYILLKSVTIHKHPYLRPALEIRRKDIKKILQAA